MKQVVICLRWVSDSLDVHEEFIGLHVVDSIDANTLVSVIKDVLLRFNLLLSRIRGQCYDGASWSPIWQVQRVVLPHSCCEENPRHPCRKA